MTDPITVDDALALLETICERAPYVTLRDDFVAVSLDRWDDDGRAEITVWDDEDRQIATGVLRIEELVDARPAPTRQDNRDEAAIDAADMERERAGAES